MDKNKREELINRRIQLQEEVRLKELRELLAPQISQLEMLGESYVVYYSSEFLYWIASNVRVRNRDGYSGIHGDFQIDIVDEDGLKTIHLYEEEINSEIFKEQFASLISLDNKLVVCYQGGEPELEISVNAFLSNPLLFFSRPETWIITTDKTWILEYIWDQRVIRFVQLQETMPILILKIIIENQ